MMSPVKRSSDPTRAQPWWPWAAVALVGIVLATAFSVWAEDAHAAVRAQPNVELVKVFSVYEYDRNCPDSARCLEDKVNTWLQKEQPGIRIIQRQLAVNKYKVYLAIFYEVPEWRKPQPKQPAEAVP